MRRTLAVAAIAIPLCIAACSPRDASQAQPVPKLEGVSPAAPAAQRSSETVFEFTFGFRNGTAADDARIVRIEDSPCGDLPVARVSSIPMDDKVLVAEPVVEFDAAGREIAHWGKPNGAEVTALDGRRLQFLANGNAYWTDAAGTLDSVGISPPTPDNELLSGNGMFPCPALPTFPAKDGSQQCFRVRDAAGKQRLIALEGVCS